MKGERIMLQRQRRSSRKAIFQNGDSPTKSNNELFLVDSCERGGGGDGDSSSFTGEAIDTKKSHGNHSSTSISIFHQQSEKLRNYFKTCFQDTCVNCRRCASYRMLPQRQAPSAAFFIRATVIIALFITYLRQFDAYYVREYQGPLDHFASDVSKLYFGMFCPNFVLQQHVTGMENVMGHSRTTRFLNASSKNCKDMPRIFMIGVRHEDEDTYDNWITALHQYYSIENDGGPPQTQHMPILERINTFDMSNKYALSGGALWNSTLITDNRHLNLSTEDVSLTMMKPNRNNFLCRKMKWEHRLFAVYQTIFSHLLASYPNDSGFVVIEDDAVLNQTEAFLEEVCNARNENMEFYSLYQSPKQWRGVRRHPSCIYIHGTVAFYIQRTFMQKIINERRREWFCRFPIDMYISIMGPWYATTREIVGHSGARRVGTIA